MRISIQRSDERGATELGWLHSRHSFSFANYYNHKKMGFGLLRVFNDDVVEPGKGFGTHQHNNMEIISIVLEGTLEHKDSMGNHDIIPAGEIQRISAGTGISHSEVNHSSNENVHFLQVWVIPKEMGIKPSYEQKSFSKIPKNKLNLVVSCNKEKNSIYIAQDAYFSIGNFENYKEGMYKLNNPKNGVYAFVIKGSINLEDKKLESGDAAEITETGVVKFKADEESNILIIEIPMI